MKPIILGAEEALDHAREQDRKRAKKKDAAVDEAMLRATRALPDWMQDRSRLPLRPPGRP